MPQRPNRQCTRKKGTLPEEACRAQLELCRVLELEACRKLDLSFAVQSAVSSGYLICEPWFKIQRVPGSSIKRVEYAEHVSSVRDVKRFSQKLKSHCFAELEAFRQSNVYINQTRQAK